MEGEIGSTPKLAKKLAAAGCSESNRPPRPRSLPGSPGPPNDMARSPEAGPKYFEGANGYVTGCDSNASLIFRL